MSVMGILEKYGTLAGAGAGIVISVVNEVRALKNLGRLNQNTEDRQAADLTDERTKQVVEASLPYANRRAKAETLNALSALSDLSSSSGSLALEAVEVTGQNVNGSVALITSITSKAAYAIGAGCNLYTAYSEAIACRDAVREYRDPELEATKDISKWEACRHGIKCVGSLAKAGAAVASTLLGPAPSVGATIGVWAIDRASNWYCNKKIDEVQGEVASDSVRARRLSTVITHHPSFSGGKDALAIDVIHVKRHPSLAGIELVSPSSATPSSIDSVMSPKSATELSSPRDAVEEQLEVVVEQSTDVSESNTEALSPAEAAF